MALLDHFRPPLSIRRHWHAFHNGWAANLSAALNLYLPEGYFAEPTVHYGIEVDVATFEEPSSSAPPKVLRETATIPYMTQPREIHIDQTWQTPPPVYSLPFQPSAESVEVLIYDGRAGPVLVGAIELVSPANKDRPAERSAFVSKCEAYLSRGIGLIIIDIVTTRKRNLHNALMQRLDADPAHHAQAELYTVAYRVLERNGQAVLDMWPTALALNEDLPTMPLWLHGDVCVPAALNDTYMETCMRHRIPLSE